jgi:hypothetical protein
MGNIRNEIKVALDQEHRRIDIGPAGTAFANCIMDPLNQGGDKNPKVNAAAYPDGSPVDGLVMTVTATSTFLGSTATSCFISIMPPNSVNGGQIDITYGEEAMDDTKTMSAVTIVNYNEYALANTIIPGVGNRVRILGVGINVVPTSAADMTSGIARAYNITNPCRSAAAAYRTNVSLRTDPVGQPQPLAGGITVRSTLQPNRMNYEIVPLQYGAYEFIYGSIPCIVLSGMGANTTVQLQVALHYQVRLSTATIPFAVNPTPIEPELNQLIAWVNRQAHVTTGHSFSSFFRNVWSGFKKTFGFVQNALNVVGPVIGTLDKANWAASAVL